MDVEQNSDKSNPSKRKLKKLCMKIKGQMEFYFSDSNLVKDKFLRNLISQDPDGLIGRNYTYDQIDVDLAVFTTFNKIKALTNSCDIIASSVCKSSLFEVSEDQKRVRRVTQLDLNKDFDTCTLYVEKLPTHADQKWVMDVFGHFGTIRYVNVPRYKVTNKIKGFAFIEFEFPECVKSACEYYKPASEKECNTSDDESKINKNVKKHKLNDSLEKKSKKSRSRTTSESSDKVTSISSSKGDHYNHGTPEKSIDNQNHKRKRQRNDSVGEDLPKRLKLGSNSHCEDSLKIHSATVQESVTSHVEEMVSEADAKIKTVESSKKPKIDETSMITDDASFHKVNNEIFNESELEDKANELDQSKSKKKRRNSKKHRSHHADKPSLRVMPKSEWKMYRNKYLELQRSTMSRLKKQILFEIQELKDQECNSKVMEVIQDSKKSLKFLPGIIIKVKLDEPVKSSLDLKEQVKENVVVAYIDAPVDSSEIFLRCHTPEDASHIIKENKLSHFGIAELLKGEDEKLYWEKIENDRKIKYSNPVSHKKRGRDKLIAKAAKLEEMKNKHIYFDE